MCDNCIHQAVCYIQRATGGHTLSCIHHIGRGTKRDENGYVNAPRLPMIGEEMAVALTREEWATVQSLLIHAADKNWNTACQWENNCKDQKMASENATLYKEYAEGVSKILKKIEAQHIADYLIGNGVTIATDNNAGGKWIPVTERLPDMEVEVLTCTQDGNIEISHWTFMNSGKVEWRDGNWRTSEGITHWMPLPEPPKGE